MKMRLGLITFLLSVGLLRAADVPSTISGAIFTDVFSVRAFGGRPVQVVGIVRRNDVYILNPNGSFVRLYATQLRDGVPMAIENAVTVQGTWSYKKTDANTSLLSLSGTADTADIAPFEHNYTLSFDTPTTGTSTGVSSQLFDTRFEIVPFPSRSRVGNVSARAFLKASDSASFGFVVSADGALVLVRAVGPSLASFGVSDALREPRLGVYRAGTTVPIATNAAWSSGDIPSTDAVRGLSRAVGAFPLVDGSKDSALVLSLPAGAYVAVVSAADATEAGQVLTEIYVLP